MACYAGQALRQQNKTRLWWSSKFWPVFGRDVIFRKCDFTHSKNSGKSRTCRGYSELKFGRSEMATTAPKGDDRSEKRRRPFGKATTVYETEICLGDPSVIADL
ncbi:hypothetical protein Bbelb_304320 [Branchiostoma belcheri]|nr:hypothetical protein Bbelb_304320 [Branchiostoma belcheri]